MRRLPQGWRLAPLETVAAVTLGQSPPGSSYNENGNGIPFFQGKAEFTDTYARVRKYTTAATKFAQAGDVLLSVRAPVGPVNLAPVNCAIGRGLAAIRPLDDLNVKYLFWILKALGPHLASMGAGSTFTAITGLQVRKLAIPLPPLREQLQIVNILEDHSSHLDTAELYLSNATKRIDAWRRSVLLRMLLPGQSQPGATLSEQHLAGPFPPAVTLPEGWEWKKWREVGSSQNGKLFPSRDYVDAGVRLLRPGNLGPDGFLRWPPHATRHLPEKYADTARSFLLTRGDVVVNLTAQSLKDDFLGRACIVGPGDESLLNQRIARLRSELIVPEFLLLVLQSPLFRRYVASLNKGSLIQHIFTKQIAEFWLPMPPRSVQVKIAQFVDRRLDAVQRTERTAQATIARVEALRRSLLNAALSGNLTSHPSDDLERAKEMASV